MNVLKYFNSGSSETSIIKRIMPACPMCSNSIILQLNPYTETCAESFEEVGFDEILKYVDMLNLCQRVSRGF